MTKHMKMLTTVLLTAFAFISAGAQTPSAAPIPAASSSLMDHADDYKPGEGISLRLKFNRSLPENAQVYVNFNSQNQGFQGQSNDIKGDRTELLIKTTIPDSAIGGDWRVASVVVVANGSGQATQSIELKDQIHFVVRGRTVEFPTSATGSLIRSQ